jgi:hypothetical protein
MRFDTVSSLADRWTRAEAICFCPMILYTFQKNGRENVGIFIEISIGSQMSLSNECTEKTTLEELGGAYGAGAACPICRPSSRV